MSYTPAVLLGCTNSYLSGLYPLQWLQRRRPACLTSVGPREREPGQPYCRGYGSTSFGCNAAWLWRPESNSRSSCITAHPYTTHYDHFKDILIYEIVPQVEETYVL